MSRRTFPVTSTIEARLIKPRDYLPTMDVTVVSVSHLPEFHVRLRYLGGKGSIHIPKVQLVTVTREVSA